MSETKIKKWLLSGGGGFEGTPEASTFTFIGLVDMIEAYSEEQQATIARLRGALDNYGTHSWGCERGVNMAECNCGLDAALREAGESSKKEETK